MTADQLNLLGDHAQPADDELGPVQREAMRTVRELGTLTRDEAGAIAHSHRDKHGVDERCAFCAIDGGLLVESLLKRGLVESAGGGSVQLPRVVLSSDDVDPFPAGF